MPDRLALAIGLIAAAAIGVDLVWNDAEVMMFLARKFVTFVEWVSFWR